MKGKYLSGNTRALLAYTTRTVVIFSSNLRRYSSVDIKELSSVVSKFPITLSKTKNQFYLIMECEQLSLVFQENCSNYADSYYLPQYFDSNGAKYCSQVRVFDFVCSSQCHLVNPDCSELLPTVFVR